MITLNSIYEVATSKEIVQQFGGAAAYRQVNNKYTLPTEGFYNYSNYFSTSGRPEFLYGHGSINLFSY